MKITCFNNFGEEVCLPADKFVKRPSVYAVFIDDGQVLLCRNRSNGKLWLPGGGIDEGEELESALKREVFEELGWKGVEVKNKLGQFQNYFYYQPTDEAMDAELMFYACECGDMKLPNNEEINDHEAHDWAWYDFSLLEPQDFTNCGDRIIRLLK